ncbi:MAG: hypothetical protein JWM44_1936 [Bacilli bacterium]|nr:hypothetical protein [Bacilli bacterium]
MMKKYVLGTMVCAALWLGLLTVGMHTSYAANTVLSDDFSKENNSWKLLGSAKRTKDGKIMLTPSEQSKVGTIWLKQTLKPPYVVDFRFQMTGIDPSHIGADGITFMFNKQQNTSPISGGGMGFEINNGYGVEFDSYSNSFDPKYNHISLFKNNPDHSVSPALQQVQASGFEDTNWHNVKIDVGIDTVKIYLDNTLKINWSGTIDSSFSGIGFTASTGFYYNTQYIDDVTITKPAAVNKVSSTFTNGVYHAGSVIPIHLTFNDIIQVTGTPTLSLKTGKTASYVSGSGTNTLTFNYTVQAGDSAAILNYASQTALSLNGGTITDSLAKPIDLNLPALNDNNSLAGNKKITIDASIQTSDTIVDLSQLNLLNNSLTLSPAFDPKKLAYIVTVPNNVSDIDLIPSLSDAQSTISVTGAAYQSGTIHTSTSLDIGANLITITVTSTSNNITVHNDYTINAYRLSASKDIIDFSVQGQVEPAVINTNTHTVTLSVYDQTNRTTLVPQVTVSAGASFLYTHANIIDFSAPVEVKVIAEDETFQLWTITIDELQDSTIDLNGLTVSGGVLSPAFNPNQFDYWIEPDGNATTINILPSGLSNNVNLTVLGATYTVTNSNSVYTVDITASPSFTLQITSLDGTSVLENYTFHINRWLASASSNAEGNRVVLVFKQALDPASLNPANFTFANGGPIVTAVRYESFNSQGMIVYLSLSSTITAQDSPLLNISGVNTMSGKAVHIVSDPIISLAGILQLRHTLDSQNDGIHIDDIVQYMNKIPDLNGDNKFDIYDAVFLLKEL